MPIRLASIFSGVMVVALAGCADLRIPRLPASDAEKPAAAAEPSTRIPRPARPAKSSAEKSPASEAQAVGAIRAGLRRLVVAEETFFAENGVYTDDLDRLRFTPPGETKLRFLWASRDGWAVSGTHPAFAGRDCVIYVGRAHGAPTTLKNVRSGREGVPVCDTISRERRPAASARAAGTPAPAPAAPPTAPPSTTPAEQVLPDTGNALDAVDPFIQMRVDLRNLERSQNTYFAQQGVYARRTEPFALQYLWHRGVTITILSSDAESWAARATHRLRPGKSCVIWFGPVRTLPATAADKRVPDRPVEPACDD